MLLRTLTLSNFRQFKGEQKITFAQSPEKNVTVILGANTSGKTTLIQAFNWVLYGKTNFETKDFMLNLEIADQLPPGESAEVRVALELIHDNVEYTISMKQEYYHGTTGVKPQNCMRRISYKLSNGQTEIMREAEHRDMINKILPEDLASYFFFDGERIGNLGKNNNAGRQDIANAIRSVLGLHVLDTAIFHLSRKGYRTSVIGKLKSSVDTEGNTALEVLRLKAEKCREELENIRTRLEDCQKVIRYCRKEEEDLSKELLENQDTAALKQEMERNESEINLLMNSAENQMKKIRNEFSTKASMYFMRPLVAKALSELQKSDLSDKGVPHVHSETIDFLLKAGHCICGTEVKEGSAAHQSLVALKNYLPPQSIGTMVRMFNQDAYHFEKIGSELFDSIREHFRELRRAKLRISELASRNESISELLQGKKDIGQIEKKLVESRKRRQEHQEIEKELARNQGGLENEISRVEKEMTRLASTSARNRFLNLCVKYAEQISLILEAKYQEMEARIRLKLEQKVNSIFGKMYHGQRTITIDPRYEYDLITPNLGQDLQGKADESRGLETITSFAFIAGIVELAKEKIAGNEGEDQDGVEVLSEPYPLVMDAPFSNADEHHVERVSKILPEVAEQVVMILMHKDWRYAEEVLGPKLELMYEIEKKSETHSVVRSVNYV